MGKYRVLRFEFPASSSPNFEFPASGKLGHLNRTEFSAYSSEFSASGKLGQLNISEFSAYSSEFSASGRLGQHNLTEFSAYLSEFSAKGVLCIFLTSIGIFASLVVFCALHLVENCRFIFVPLQNQKYCHRFSNSASVRFFI